MTFNMSKSCESLHVLDRCSCHLESADWICDLHIGSFVREVPIVNVQVFFVKIQLCRGQKAGSLHCVHVIAVFLLVC